MSLSGPQQVKAILARFPQGQHDVYAPMATLFFKAKHDDESAAREFNEFKEGLKEQGKFPEFQNYVKNCYMPIQRIRAEQESKIQKVDSEISSLSSQVDAISHQQDLEKQRALKSYQEEVNSSVGFSAEPKKKNCTIM